MLQRVVCFAHIHLTNFSGWRLPLGKNLSLVRISTHTKIQCHCTKSTAYHTSLKFLICLATIQKMETPSEALSELPIEVWRKILDLACKDADLVNTHAIINFLRTRSKTLREASYTHITRMRMYNTQIAPLSVRLKDLNSTASVTVFFATLDNVSGDLLQLSEQAPNLTSLILRSTPADKAAVEQSAREGPCSESEPQWSTSHGTIPDQEPRYFTIKTISSVLAPWKNSLQHLCLDGCKLSMCSLNLAGFIGWGPDFPELISLILTRSLINGLSLRNCTKLETLDLTGNTSLTIVDAAHVLTLSKVTFMYNTQLSNILLYHNTNIKFCMCWHNHDNLYIQAPGITVGNFWALYGIQCPCAPCKHTRMQKANAVRKDTTMLRCIKKRFKLLVQLICCCQTSDFK